MFGALPMRHVTLYLLQEELPLAALVLAKMGILDADTIDADAQREGTPAARFRQQHANASQLYLKISRTLQFHPPVPDPAALPADVDGRRLESLHEKLRPIWSRCNRHEESMRSLREQIRQLQQQQRAVATFLKLRLDLELLYSEWSPSEKPVHTDTNYIGLLEQPSEKRTVFNTSVEMPATSTSALKRIVR